MAPSLLAECAGGCPASYFGARPPRHLLGSHDPRDAAGEVHNANQSRRRSPDPLTACRRCFPQSGLEVRPHNTGDLSRDRWRGGAPRATPSPGTASHGAPSSLAGFRVSTGSWSPARHSNPGKPGSSGARIPLGRTARRRRSRSLRARMAAHISHDRRPTAPARRRSKRFGSGAAGATSRAPAFTPPPACSSRR
jgi:hypothetical protein